MKRNILIGLSGVFFLAVLLVVPASASADAVTDWNAIAVQATVTGARPGATCRRP